MESSERSAVRQQLSKIGFYGQLPFGYQEVMEEDIFQLTNGSADWDADLVEKAKKRYELWDEVANAGIKKAKAFLSIYGLPRYFNPGATNYDVQYLSDVLKIIGDAKQIDASMQAKIHETHARYQEQAEEAWRDNKEDQEVSRRVRASLGLD